MKICYVANEFEVYNYRFLKKMSEHGLQVTHVAFGVDRAKTEGIFGEKIAALPGIERHYLPSAHPGWRDDFANLLALRRIVSETKPDILHGGWATSTGFNCALTGYHPFLLMPWGSDILIEPVQSRWRRVKARYALRQADAVTCDSEYQKAAALRVGNIPSSKVTTFPWGIEREIFTPQPGTIMRAKLGWQENTVLIMNRAFRDVCGHRHFVPAFMEVVRRQPQTRLVLLNSGELLTEVLADLDRRGLHEYYHYAGEVDSPTMACWLNNADIYVATSMSDGTSASMLEAMSCGLPVVVSDIPVNYEWVRPGVNGFITRRGDSADIARQLERLIVDPALRCHMRDENLKLAAVRADWNRNFEVLLGIYDKLQLRLHT